VTVFQELIQELGATVTSVQVIKNDGCVEKDGCHQRFWRRMVCSNLWSGSEPDFLNSRRTTPGQLRMVTGIPCTSRKAQSIALLPSPDIMPKQIRYVGGTRLVLGFGQPIQLSGEFLRYFDYAWHMRSPLNSMLAQGVAKDGLARDVGGVEVSCAATQFFNLAKRSQGGWLGRPEGIRVENNKRMLSIGRSQSAE
jgi:hypothetical protein